MPIPRTAYVGDDVRTTIGDYQIRDELGSGGMGVVYRAFDPRLEREVAVKTLRDGARSSEELSRFRREAALLAKLNHPHIGAIYGLEEHDGAIWLILELVEGETLQKRIARGPIPVPETLEIASQIASALEAAHDSGIVHRDLKPGNIKLTPQGKVKVLDFGVARAMSRSGAALETGVPTLSRHTAHGALVGTAPFMSPEQAKGEEVDERADVWAFAAVVFEMLTATRAFAGETSAEALSAVLTRDPDWSLLPPETPSSLVRMLRRGLRKDPEHRLHHIADARLDLEDATIEDGSMGSSSTSTESPWRWAGWVAALVLLVSTALLAGALRSRSAEEVVVPDPRVVRFDVVPASSPDAVIRELALSPDDRYLAYVVSGTGESSIEIRDLRTTEVRRVPSSAGARSLAYSKDGSELAFWAAGGISKIRVPDGRPVRVAAAPGINGISWGEDGSIYVAQSISLEVRRISPDGGEADPVVAPPPDVPGTQYYDPQKVAGQLLFTALLTRTNSSIQAFSLEKGTRRTLVEPAASARYVDPGYLAFFDRGVLEVAPYDLESGELTGAPRAVLSGVGPAESVGGLFTVSAGGSLAYVLGADSEDQLAIVGAGGELRRLPLQSPSVRSPRVSPNGRRLVVSLTANAPSLWLYDLDRGSSRRLTDDDTREWWNAWAPDSRTIVFQSTPDDVYLDLYRLDVDSTAPARELLGDERCALQPQVWLGGPERILFHRHCIGEENLGIWELDPASGAERVVLDTAAQEKHPSVSPDGRWLAYASDASGIDQVFVSTFPEPGQIVQVSTGPGWAPRWSPDGGSIVYESEGTLLRAAFDAGPPLQIGEPELVFAGPMVPSRPWGANWDVFPDGERFLVTVPTVSEGSGRVIRVVLAWRSELEELFR